MNDFVIEIVLIIVLRGKAGDERNGEAHVLGDDFMVHGRIGQRDVVELVCGNIAFQMVPGDLFDRLDGNAEGRG